MTNQQGAPEALRLADEAWNFDCSEYRGVRSANAAMMGKLQDCADMIRKLHTENTMLQAGYAAARLEIESLQARIKTMAEEHADELMVAHMDGIMRAAQPAGAQQPGTAYAELPSYEHQRAIMEAERNASLDEYSRIVPLTSTESMIYERAFTNGWNRHASHGQAPAQQPAPSAAATQDMIAAVLQLVDLEQGDVEDHRYDDGSKLAKQICKAVLALVPQPSPTPQADSQPAPAAAAGPVEWRELAARVMDALADAQEQTNSAYPAHASRYPAWEAHARWLRWHADMFRTGKPVGSGAGQPAVLAALAAAPTTQPALRPAVRRQPTEALARAEYYIDNPSAWSSFDQRTSDDISDVTNALRAALAALNDAATSLETIAHLAGRTAYGTPPIETNMETLDKIRIYAAARALVASAAQECSSHGLKT